MTRGLFGFLLLISVLFGSPFVNIALMRLIGTHVVTYNPGQPDTHVAISGAMTPRPAWLPALPKATVVTANQVISGGVDGFGSVDLATTLSLDEIKDFYSHSLSELGFQVHDAGISPLSPSAANLLGMAGTLLAERPADSAEEYKWMSVQIRTEEGWIVKTRYVSVQWRRTKPAMLAR